MIVSGSFFTKMGFVVGGILRNRLSPIQSPPKSSWLLKILPLQFHVSFECTLLEGSECEDGSGEKTHAVLIANVVGCGFSSSNVGVINSFKN